jgi:hypothetical protein
MPKKPKNVIDKLLSFEGEVNDKLLRFPEFTSLSKGLDSLRRGADEVARAKAHRAKPLSPKKQAWKDAEDARQAANLERKQAAREAEAERIEAHKAAQAVRRHEILAKRAKHGRA